MRYIGIIILLVFCLTLLLLTGCVTNTGTPETASGNLENQEDINQSSNNSQSSLTGSVEEPVIEDTEEPAEETVTVYPQQWATGDGTAENPWANDCIQKAYDAMPTGGTIYLRAGYYELNASLDITKQINVIGEGMGKTIILTAGGTVSGFYSEGTDYISIKNLTIDGDAQTDGTTSQGVIVFNGGDYILLENLEIMNGGYYGIDLFECNYLTLKNIYSHDNYRHGVHAGSNTAGENKHNTYQNIYAWDNGNSGFDDRGCDVDPELQRNNIYDNLQCWDNGESGITLQYLSGCTLSNSFLTNNTEFGLYMPYCDNTNINDCTIISSGDNGIELYDTDNLSFVNVISKNNDGEAGIYIDDGAALRFTNCQFYDDRDTPKQDYGIVSSESSNIDYIELTDCTLMPNKIAAIYNVSETVIVVITEKMLAKF